VTVALLRTAQRARIGAAHGWPLGASALSSGLEGVPQVEEINLEFGEPDAYALRHGRPFLVLEARFHAAGPSVHRPRKVPLPRFWQIRVRAVPRETKARIAEALGPALRDVLRPWLLRHGRAEGRDGQAWLAFAWDSEAARLVHGSEDRLLPERSRS
jgi:hypothetical protein